MHIILIGYRGTGKSAVGEILAKRLGMPFFDMDELIEDAAGRSIGEIVAERGWEDFREKEREAIRRIESLERSVIATGGGAVMDPVNARILKRCGVLIWLHADVRTIVERIQNDRTSRKRRPSLSRDDIVTETKKMLELRTPVYRGLADFSIDTRGLNIDETVAAICRFLGASGKGEEEMICREIP